MNESQTSLYWRLWGNACRVQGWNAAGGLKAKEVEAKRKEVMRAKLLKENLINPGEEVSSKDLTNDQFTAVKAAFKTLANDLKGAIEDDKSSIGKARQWFTVIENQKKCLALYLPEGSSVEAYVDGVIRDKFNKGRRSERISIEALGTEPGTPRLVRGYLLERPSEVEQLMITLSGRIQKFRKAAGHTGHQMHMLAGSTICSCKPCTAQRRLERAGRYAEQPIDESEPVGVQMATSEGDPW